MKTRRAPTAEEWVALEFGWKVVKHVKSNAIVYARPGQTAAVGAGQMSRVDSVKIGAMKAHLPLEGTIVASDAYFPFPDGLEQAAKHGATAFIQPGGSVKDAEVIAAADRLGVAMVFTGMRHFSGTKGFAAGVSTLVERRFRGRRHTPDNPRVDEWSS